MAIQAGESLKVYLKRVLTEAGITEATSAHVTFNNGETIIVASPENPVMERSMTDISKVEVKRSAEAGAK